MKLLIALLISVMLSGCAQLSGPLVKMSHENYVANKALAEESLLQCAAKIGFIDGLGIMDKTKFPITTIKELRAIINSPAASLGLIELRDVCENKAKKPDGTPYWDPADYYRFYVLGAEVRMGVQSAVDIAKMIFPDFMAAYLKFL